MNILFEERIAELGIEKENLSGTIKDGIKAFNNAYNDYEEALMDLENAEEDDVPAMQESINELEASLQAADTKLVKKINNWYKNKDAYAANYQNMVAKRAEKAASAGTVPPTTVEPLPQTTVDPVPPTTVQSAPPTTIIEVTATGVVEEKKKGKSWLFWGIVAIVAVATAGTVFLNKED